jgi:hypothetical protein
MTIKIAKNTNIDLSTEKKFFQTFIIFLDFLVYIEYSARKKIKKIFKPHNFRKK